jgi:hypothetical protein
MKFKNILKHPVLPYLVLIVFSALILIPLLKTGFPVTDDGTWMIIRLSAFYQSLREGQFPVRYLGRLNHDYGYPVSNFLYPGFLYLGSVIKLAGFNFVDSVKVIMIGSIIGTAFFTYLWLKKYFGPLNSLISAISLIFAPYILFDIYKRGSVGEILAVFCATLIFYLISRGYIYLSAFIFGILVISHNTIALFFTACFILFILIYKRYDLLKVLLFGLGLSAFFWIPALVEKQYVRFDAVSVSDPLQYTVFGPYVYLISLAPLLSGLFLVIFRSKETKLKETKSVLALFFVSLLIATPLSYPLWINSAFARFIQFPYRILVIFVISGSWLMAKFLSDIPKSHKTVTLILFSGIILFQAYLVIRQVRIQNYAEGYYTTNEATTTVSDEYMPVWVSKAPESRPVNKIQDISGSVEIKILKSTTQSIRAEINASTNSRIQINSIFYPGWGIVLNDELQKIEYNNSGGLMQINVPQGKHILFAEFRETGMRFLADLISFSSFIALVVLMFAVKNHGNPK